MELVDIDSHGHQLDKPAAADWLRLKAAAEAAGHTVVINTAYRDNNYQTRLYSAYIKAMALWTRNGSKPPKPSPVARPGCSEHEFGRAVDTPVASQSGYLTWLRQHASTFNFYNTVKSEAWHWAWRKA